MRLDKAAALAGLTRTEARKAILSGRVKVKGDSVTNADSYLLGVSFGTTAAVGLGAAAASVRPTTL